MANAIATSGNTRELSLLDTVTSESADALIAMNNISPGHFGQSQAKATDAFGYEQ